MDASFSARVRKELYSRIPQARHCRLAELAAFFLFHGKTVSKNGRVSLKLRMESADAVKKCFTILEKTFNINNAVYISEDGQEMEIQDPADRREILQGVKMADEAGNFVKKDCCDARLLTAECCRRAFLRGCFLAAGSISAPEKSYHLEIVCNEEKQAGQIREVLLSFGLDAKIVIRKKYYVVYLKESDQISDVLGLMEAPQAKMEFENARILKDVRNQVNRKVNCETANISKTAAAAAQQLEAIRYLEAHGGLESLPVGLAEIARLRLEMQEASLTELGSCADPPIGKSGVNHRLHRIELLAEECRTREEKRL